MAISLSQRDTPHTKTISIYSGVFVQTQFQVFMKASISCWQNVSSTQFAFYLGASNRLTQTSCTQRDFTSECFTSAAPVIMLWRASYACQENTHTHTHTHTHTNTHTHPHTPTPTQHNPHKQQHTKRNTTHPHTHAHTRTLTHTHTHTCTHTHTHTHTRTHTYMDTHTSNSHTHTHLSIISCRGLGESEREINSLSQVSTWYLFNIHINMHIFRHT